MAKYLPETPEKHSVHAQKTPKKLRIRTYIIKHNTASSLHTTPSTRSKATPDLPREDLVGREPELLLLDGDVLAAHQGQVLVHLVLLLRAQRRDLGEAAGKTVIWVSKTLPSVRLKLSSKLRKVEITFSGPRGRPWTLEFSRVSLGCARCLCSCPHWARRSGGVRMASAGAARPAEAAP